jgi:hypothetical protein
MRLSFELAPCDSARIINNGTATKAAFRKVARKLGLPPNGILNAIHDLTKVNKREADPPR